MVWLVRVSYLLGLQDFEMMSSISASWYNIGAYLGVKIALLEDLKALPSGQVDRIVRWWLGGDMHLFDYYMEPCWQTLVKAIAHPAGGDNVLAAEEVALSHLAPSDRHFIGKLYAHMHISDQRTNTSTDSNLSLGCYI